MPPKDDVIVRPGQKEIRAKDIVLHPGSVLAICTTVLMVGMYIMTNDKGLSDDIIELSVRQEIIFETLDKIENNHLAHIQDDMEEIKNALVELEIKMATLINNH